MPSPVVAEVNTELSLSRLMGWPARRARRDRGQLIRIVDGDEIDFVDHGDVPATLQRVQ